MFERFSGQARGAVEDAQEQARQLSQRAIGTEHLLLGLLAGPLREALKPGHKYIGAERLLLALIRDREGVAGSVLAGAGADPAAARAFAAGLVADEGMPPEVADRLATMAQEPRPGGLLRRRKRSG